MAMEKLLIEFILIHFIIYNNKINTRNQKKKKLLIGELKDKFSIEEKAAISNIICNNQLQIKFLIYRKKSQKQISCEIQYFYYYFA